MEARPCQEEVIFGCASLRGGNYFLARICLHMLLVQLSPSLDGHTFLASAHMDSGRLLRVFISSLAAFWPGMQALCGG